MKHDSGRPLPSLTNGGVSRRDFLASAVAGVGAAALTSQALQAAPARGPYQGKFLFFSKALPDMDWRRLAESAKRVGFQGFDLTVRPGGHVLPEKAAEDLPKAVSILREEGLEVPMITTALVSADDPAARLILSIAGKLGIQYCKTGYYQYRLIDVRKELKEAGRQFRGLAELARENGMQVGYHNHAGKYVGAPLWDMATVIEPLNSKWVGYYFDPRHAVAEGGVGAWKIATNLVLPRLKMVAVKDFFWQKTTKGWEDVNCPLGEGIVDWKYFFKTIGEAGFHGPISLHLEYDIPGSSSAAKEDHILAAARRDLDFLKAKVHEAYSEN